MALQAFQIQKLDSHGLSLQTRAELVINEALVDGAEPAFSDEVVGGEVLADHLQLSQREHMKV